MTILFIAINFITATLLSYIISRHSTKKMVHEIKKLQVKNSHLEAENMILMEYLDQLTAPSDSKKEAVSTNSDSTDAKLKYNCRYNLKEEKMKIKYIGTASMAPYQFYHKRKVQMPDWAVECSIKYRRERQDKRKDPN